MTSTSSKTLITEREPAPDSEPRLYYGDGIRVCAIVAVLWIHIVGPSVSSLREENPANWLLCNLITSACRWAVPVFIMLSGALLLEPSRPITLEQFYRKRISRIGIPLVFWSGFYLLWDQYHLGRGANLKLLGKYFLLSVFHAMPYYHLYFLFALFGLYLFVPAFRALTGHVPLSTVRLVSLSALALACGDSILRSRKGIGLNSFSHFVPFVGYFVLGYWLRHTDADRNQARKCVWILVLCIAVTAAGTWLLTGRWGTRPWTMELYDYFSPTVIPMSIAAFVLMKHLFSSGAAAGFLCRPCFRTLAGATFGIYLVHPFLLDLISMGLPLSGNPMLMLAKMAVTFVVLTATSYLVTKVIERVPGLRATIG